MKSITASLRTLILPFGSTTGQRIVLDGVNGQIAIYNTDNELITTFDPTGLTYFSTNFPGSRVFFYDPINNVLTIYVDDGTETAVIQLDGRTDTQGIWVFDAVDDGYVHITPDIGGTPGIEFLDTLTASNFLSLPGTDGSYTQTPDNATDFDFPGDFEAQIDIQTNDWTPAISRNMFIKNANVGDVDWSLRLLTTGILRFTWVSEDADDHAAESTVAPTPGGDGRLAIKVTLDVNNGAAGRDIKFFTAATIAGPYVQLGATVTQLNVTNVRRTASKPVRIGGENTPGSVKAWAGKVYAFKLLDGIGGTLVANPDFTIQSSGAVSFVDSTGKTWTMVGSALITTTGGTPGYLRAAPGGDDVFIEDQSIPRGIMGRWDSTVSDSTRAAGVNTQAFVTFDAIAGRLYEVWVNVIPIVGTASGTYVIDLSEGGTVGSNNGTVIQRFIRIQPVDTTQVNPPMVAVVTYAPSSSGSKTLRIRNGSGSGGTIQLSGTPNTQQMVVKDIGLA